MGSADDDVRVHERHTRDSLDDDYEFPGYDAVRDRFWEEFEQLRE